MGILKDFWNYMLYKQKVMDDYRAKGGTLVELNWKYNTGPLIFLLLATPFLVWFNFIYWKAAMLANIFYGFFILALVLDFKNSYMSVKNKPSLVRKKSIKKEVGNLYIYQKNQQDSFRKLVIPILIIISLIVMLVVREILVWLIFGWLIVILIACYVYSIKYCSKLKISKNEDVDLKNSHMMKNQEYFAIVLGALLMVYNLFVRYSGQILFVGLVFVAYGLYKLKKIKKFPFN